MKWVPWEDAESVIKMTFEKRRKDHLVRSKVKHQVRCGPLDDDGDGENSCHCHGHGHCHHPCEKRIRAEVTISGTLPSCQVLY